MTKILIVYTSSFGNTKTMAKSMATALSSIENVCTTIKNCDNVIADDFLDADAILLGTPVKMGTIDWKLKKMIDTIMGPLWVKDELTGKVGGCFATGGGFGKAGAGVELTLTALANVLMEMGIIYVPLPKNTLNYKQAGLQWGAYGITANEDMTPKNIADNNLIAAKIHAQNIARVAMQLKDKNVLKPELV